MATARGQVTITSTYDGGDSYRLEVTSSSGLVYHNHVLGTTLTAHVYGPEGEVTDRCTGTFTWFLNGKRVDTGKNLNVAPSGTVADSYRYTCVFEGEVSKKVYQVVYGGKVVTFGGKAVVSY